MLLLRPLHVACVVVVVVVMVKVVVVYVLVVYVVVVEVVTVVDKAVLPDVQHFISESLLFPQYPSSSSSYPSSYL